jgi:hypothetical protein
MDCKCVKQDNYTIPKCVGTQCDICPECTRETSAISKVTDFLSDPYSNIETVPLWLVYTMLLLLLLAVLSTVALVVQT